MSIDTARLREQWWDEGIEAYTVRSLCDEVDRLRQERDGVRSATCPTCGSDDPKAHGNLAAWREDGTTIWCPDPWHGEG